MSIIEKAIAKLQNASAGGAVATVTRTVGVRRAREASPSPSDRARPAREPARSIPIDLGQLSTQGLVPGAQGEGRSQEEFRRIKRPLLESVVQGAAAAGEASSNVIMVTSSIAGEGKTYVSFNLARSIAREQDFSVLLVDADVAKRHLTNLLNAGDAQGLTDGLVDPAVDPEDLVLGTSIPGLMFLPAGTHTSATHELFSSQRMASVVSHLGRADRHRVVLFDSSPLLVTSESPVLARLVDQVLVVVCAESTQQPLVLEAIALLDRSKAIRSVLNQSRLSAMSEYYYGYEHYQRAPETP
jgi:protein-tyrosine kinase